MGSAQTSEALEVLQRHIGGCREWPEGETGRCGQPAEYVLWGKLIPTDGLGPRCYDCASKWVGRHALASGSDYAVIHLGDLARDLTRAETNAS